MAEFHAQQRPVSCGACAVMPRPRCSLLCYSQLKTSACDRSGVAKPGASPPRLCQYLPAIEDQVKVHVAAVLQGCSLEAACCAAVLALSSWYAWELCFVEKRAMKQKRRRRRRKHGCGAGSKGGGG
jgi:hypothetical protein